MDSDFISRVGYILFNRYHLNSASLYANPVEVPELSTDYLTTTLALDGDKLIIKTDTSAALKERGVFLLPTPFVFACGKRRRFGDVFLNDHLRLIVGYRLSIVVKRVLSELRELKYSDKYNEYRSIIIKAEKEPETIMFRFPARTN